jgi:hypothetical protein
MSDMPLPATLPVALKEWKLTTDALASGRQILLLRKGGIYEAGGEFELEHKRFVFFPTYIHQHLHMLKPEFQAGFEQRSAEPDKVTLAVAGEVTDIIQIQNRPQMERLDAEHIWTAPLLDMRFGYRPENPLYLVLVRAYRLASPITVDNTPTYAGCKSWVPLERPIDTVGATPVMDDATYAERVGQIRQTLG